MIAPKTRRLIKQKNIFFALYFALLLLLAIFPPFYLSISNSSIIVFGIPLPIFYWLAIAILLAIGLSVMYCIETILGEIPEEEYDA
jgi:hypothetical protein